MSKKRNIDLLAQLSHLRWNFVYKGMIVGILSGLTVSLYRLATEYGYEWSLRAYGFLRHNPIYLLLWFILTLLGGYFIYLILKYEPNSKGSGIPQVEGLLKFGMKMKWNSIIAARFIAGSIMSFFGLSLGREGPSIQVGASVGQGYSKLSKSSTFESNFLITAGASAGLSAAFGAPLSGVMFALEEVHHSFSPNILIASMMAVVSADFVSKYIFGLVPVLNFAKISSIPLHEYGWLILLGVATGLLGAIINRFLYYSTYLYQSLPVSLRPTIALLIAIPVGLWLPDLLGGGTHLVGLAESGSQTLQVLTILLIGKILFTTFSFGSGVPGGIFMPILSMGALFGGLFFSLISNFNVDSNLLPLLCVCAMAGMMSSSVKAPVTSILLMVEMTGSIVHLLPLAIVSFCSLLVSDFLGIKPIYEDLLERMMPTNHHPKNDKTKDGVLIEYSIDIGSSLIHQKIKDISWPSKTLITAVVRSGEYLTPDGSLTLLPSDILLFFSTERSYDSLNDEIHKFSNR